ncbi:MAG: hypothetical protein WCR51_08250 [Planctomycetia bacterium]
MTRCRHALLLCVTLWCLAPCTRAAAPGPNALTTPVTASWTGLPLRQVAARLSEIGGVAVVIDRRLDPDTSITLDASGEPLADVLDRVAAAARADVAMYAGHVRLVHHGAGAAALAAAERLRSTELEALGKRLDAGADTAWSWPDGAVPRDLVATAASQAGIVIEGLDELPHDHFPAASLPPLALADRLDLLLAHFDRRIAWQPRRGQRAGMPVFSIVALPAAATEPPAARQRPPRRRDPPRPAREPGSTYTLTVAAPLDELLSTLARRFGLTLELDRAALARAGVAPAEIVRLELKAATREQLLDAICAPRALVWRIEGDTLSVSAASR